MFWIVILIVVLITIGSSVLIGMTLNKRNQPRPRTKRQRQIDAAKASGAFSHRKSNQP